MAVPDLLSYIYGLNPGNAQQQTYNTYRNQLVNDYLNTNLSSNNMNSAYTPAATQTSTLDPNSPNFRQALFYNNYLQSQQQAAQNQNTNGVDMSVRGPAAPQPAAAANPGRALVPVDRTQIGPMMTNMEQQYLNKYGSDQFYKLKDGSQAASMLSEFVPDGYTMIGGPSMFNRNFLYKNS